MAGKKGTRKSERERGILREVLPLDAPLGINIEPTNLCNLKCRYCYQGDKDTKLETGFMSMDLFKKIIDDIKGFPRQVKSISLMLRGEPLLHPQFAEMVAYAKQSGAAKDILFFTNAILLSHEMSDKLISAGVDTINVSLQGISGEDYKRIAGVNIDFEKLLDNIRYFYEHKTNTELYVKIPYSFHSRETLDEFARIFSPICDFYQEEHIDDSWQGLAKKNLTPEEYQTISKRYDALEKYKRKVCPFPFMRLYINYDGKIMCCQEDYKGETHVIGNANVDNIVEVWNNDKHKKICYAQLTHQLDEYSLCSKDCFGYKDIHHPGNDPDNIDDLPQEVIDLYAPGK